MGCERILGDSSLLEEVLEQVRETLDQKSYLSKYGVEYKSLEQKILKTYRLDKKDLCLKSRKLKIVEARSYSAFGLSGSWI